MKHTEKFIQQRRMLMVLPVLCLPFITMLFWALGGGQGISAQAAVKPAGLNMELPDAYFNTQEKWDKLSIYERNEKDSMERDDALTLEPYFQLAALNESKQEDTVKRERRSKTGTGNTTPATSPRTPSGRIDPMEEKVNKKIEQLYQQLNAPPAVNTTSVQPTPAIKEQSIASSEIEQLERIMQSMNEPGAPDPEMEQIQNVLEKILDIQHPERVKERLQQQSSSSERKTYRVENNNDTSIITAMNVPRSDFDTVIYNVSTLPRIGFYGLDEQTATSSQVDNAIPAVIHDTQEVVSGTTIRLRLTQEVTLNGHRIPKDEYIYGTCIISGDRLMINITSMRHENSIYPVALTAFGMDGLPGVPVPGAISRDVAKQSSNQAIQGVQMMGMDPTLEMQAATLGVETAKGFLSRKTQLIKATVKAEDPLLLKDTGLHH